MGFIMPKPFKIGDTYYMRLHVPRDVARIAKGKTISVNVGHIACSVTVSGAVKVSLRTKDPKEAKARHALAQGDAERFWSALRAGPKGLTHKQSLALAGEVSEAFIGTFDENPGHQKTWERVIDVNMAAQAGQMNPLRIRSEAGQQKDLEQRFGNFADAVVGRKGLVIDDVSRARLLQHIAQALTEAAEVNLKKTQGDYSESVTSKRFPVYEKSRSKRGQSAKSTTATFDSIIDGEVARRAAGRDAKPMPEGTERKYRMAADEFAQFRRGDVVRTVSAEDGDAWRDAMTEGGRLRNNTIKQKLQNVKTIVEWARKSSLGKLFPHENPLAVVQMPEIKEVSSEQRTLTLAEARKVLTMARSETSPEKRWLPWLCAYSGASINEVAQLRQSNFFQVEGEWFYRLTTAGGRKLKNASSERRIPVHPDLVSEGLIDFMMQDEHKGAERIFPVRSQGNVAGVNLH